jgi:ABC-type multidrug transport system fused ATPase/permease subunit
MSPISRLISRQTQAGRSRIDWEAWAYLLSYYRRRCGTVVVLGILGALQSATLLPTLFMVRFAFNTAVPKGQVALLIWIGLALVAFRLAASGLMLITRLMSLRVTKGAICEMRRDLIATLYALPRDYFGRNDASRVQTRIVMETERLDNLASTLLSSILPAALTTVCLAIMLLWLNAVLVLMLAALLPLMWIGSVWGGRYVKREVRDFQQAFEGFSHGVQFVLRQMDLTRVRGFEEGELTRQSQGLRRLETSGVRMAMSFALHQQIQAGLNGIGGLLLLVGGGVAVASHAMSLGDLLAFYLAAGALNGSITKVTAVIPDLIAGDESLRTLQALREQTDAEGYDGKLEAPFDGAVSLRDVDFSYGDGPVLRNVSLDLRPGARTAIVGANGAGKSTIINLILGFYRPQAGGLMVGGRPYEDIDLKSLRRQIGVVMQKPTFFTGTIAENLTYGWSGISREAMEAAARAACADAFIRNLPDGFDTLIGEGGAMISGGESQRLAIARALIGRPKLLILDEPTNHLDADSIGRIMERITGDPDHPTILIISHDRTVVDFADEVLRLDAGRLSPSKRHAIVAPTH